MGKKISFYLMSEKGLAVLRSQIAQFGTEHIARVTTARDKNVQHDFYEEIVDHCKKNRIPCFDKSDGEGSTTEISLAISWRWVIKDIKQLIVFHDSLLPRYRGFAPLVNALINGEKKVGVTALFASNDYDRGDIIAQKAVSLNYPITIAAAIEKIIPAYCSLTNMITSSLLSGKKLTAYKQNEVLASYSLWRDEDDYRIDWGKNADEIKRSIDALGYPYKGASCIAGEKKVRIMKAEIVKDLKIINRSPGKVIFSEGGKPVIVCGKGLIRITGMHYEGGKSALPFEKFRTRFH